MVRYYCDVCGKELTTGHTRRMVGQSGRLKVEVMTALDGTWNAGHFCRYCILVALEIADFPAESQPTTQP